MDANFKQFLASGKTIIHDTMVAKSEPVKVKKGTMMDAIPNVKDWDKVLISRCKDEKISKRDVIDEFKKIIEREEEKI
jgi:hypothetical protein